MNQLNAKKHGGGGRHTVFLFRVYGSAYQRGLVERGHWLGVWVVYHQPAFCLLPDPGGVQALKCALVVSEVLTVC